MAPANDTRWVVLLRGINVGKHKRLAMADLRALLEDLGSREIRTHLNSGNALVTTDRMSAATLERAVEERLEADLGLSVKVLARSAREWGALVEENPFPQEGVDPKQLHAAVLAKPPPAGVVKGLSADAYAPDRFAFGERVVYVHMPNGYMSSRLPNWEDVLGVAATVRTWNVVTKLRDLV